MLDKRKSVDLPGSSFSNSLGEHQWFHMTFTQPLLKFEGEICIIVGFHTMSLKFKLKKYRSYRDFIFTMH